MENMFRSVYIQEAPITTGNILKVRFEGAVVDVILSVTVHNGGMFAPCGTESGGTLT